MKILVVEDDEFVAHALAAVLTNQKYTVEVAPDGQVAWNLIETYNYDLVLLDVIIPKIDGISLCRQIRSKGLRMPILLLTGCDSSHEKVVGLDAGADDYLVKPFDQEELVARIRALLRRGSLASQPVLLWGDLRLDPASCEVTYAQEQISLTPKEYSLLELFLRNSRRVFSCSMILEHLWSYEDAPSEEAVRTHIKGLRHKLKSVGAPGDVIETVYGIGYRLKPQTEAKELEEETQQGTLSSAGKFSPDVAVSSNLSFQAHEPTQQQTITAIAGVWNRFKGRIHEQVALLEEAANASHQKTLSQKLRKQALLEAHTLAGSLGTFGFTEGSNIARKIEHLLKAGKTLSTEEATQLCTWVKQLQWEIEQNSHQTISQPTTLHEHPLLLVVDCNAYSQDTPHLRSLAEQIKSEAIHYKLEVAIATTIEEGKNQLYQEHPSVVLIDPSGFQQEDSFSLLTELNQRKPPVPVLIYTNQSDFTNRLQVARIGEHTFLQKPMAMTQVLEAVTQALENAPPAEAHVLVVDDDPKIGAMLQNLLNPWGIKVTTLENPENFWKTLEDTEPDLLILDVELPKISGIEICQVVRNDARWSELPIVFLTVHSDAHIVNQVFTVGADDFVSKPIVGPELVTRIINRLERMKLRRRIALTHQAKATTELTKLNEQLQIELTKRQKAQEEVWNSQLRLAGIVEIASDAIITIDSNQRITLFNQGAEKIFGYASHEVLGKPLDILLPLRYIKAHRQYVNEFGTSTKAARRMGERSEVYGVRKDGTEFPAEASISKLNLGKEIIYTVYLRDISQRKQIERMKDEFISVVSHELRTPLTAIHGSLGMLFSGLVKPESEQGKRLLEIAVDSTECLVQVINDILDLEQIESGEITEKEVCNVTDIISEAVNLMQPLAKKAGVTLSVSNLDTKLWANPNMLIRVLTHLLSNAIKFSSAGSTVYLSAELQRLPISPSLPQLQPQILFQVKDFGRGIPVDKLNRIFERFGVVDSSDSRKHNGTGLGLAICRSIVQQHNGCIWVESVIEKGSTFYFTIPVLNDVQD